MQTSTRTLARVSALAVLGVVASFAVSTQVKAQQYVYYPTNRAYQPAYYYVQPASNYQANGTSAPQYYYYPAAAARYTYAPQAAAPQQYTYAPQAANTAQAADATQTADGRQVVQTAYTVPVAEAQPVQAAPAATYGGSDPYGFLAWLNSTRASYGLGTVGYDQNLTNWAAQNNGQQMAHGLGHFVMGPARRQNSAMGAAFPGAMWMNSPAHRAALLDPTISWIGIAAAGAYWTFNAY